jgi:hypothetical protein
MIIETLPRSKKASESFPLWCRITLLTILAYEALGAIAGGILLIAEPRGSYMQMPVEIMNGVFSDFMIPGIILLAMGILNAFAFFSVLKRKRNDWFIAACAMGGFIIWFVVEIIILQELHWLHLMWGLPVVIGFIAAIPLIISRNDTMNMHRRLLWCGVLSSIWYIAINIYVPSLYEGYSMSALTVSELSAISAPTRIVWVLLVVLYPLLFVSFGWGVMRSAQKNFPLRITGILIIIYCFFNLYWPPMHMRGTEPTLTDTMHIVWASVTVLLMMTIMGFGAAALGKKFRFYTISSIVILFIFGALTGKEAPNIPVNGPTPMIGTWERINISIFMIWVIVLAIFLIAKNRSEVKLRSISTLNAA